MGSTGNVMPLLSLSWLAGILWLLGILRAYDSFNGRGIAWVMALLAVSWLALSLWVQVLCGRHLGWQGFRHLAELPASAWLALAGAWPVVFGIIIMGQHGLDGLRGARIAAGQRMIWISATALLTGAVAHFIPGLGLGLVVGLSFFLFLLCLELYAESERTSLTWLLFWLLLFAALLAGLAFRYSLELDQEKRQSLLDVASRSAGTTIAIESPYYARRWPADSLGSRKEELLSMAIGQTKVSVDSRRALSIYRANSNEWLIVGRFMGGYRPVVALFSLLFLSGLLLALSFRGIAWLLKANLARWALPLFGDSSLRLRIQLAFLGLTLTAFLLIGLFTVQFFKQSGGVVIYEWLEQLLAVYVFLLLVAAVIGIALANGITQPIVGIGEHLLATKLSQNQPINWLRKDEIGQLVASYNNMIQQLEESAQRLAASEREDAWREMAQQVAHEIKNPLTPMKLHLQQLLRLQQEDPERATAWAARIAPALIEQIDGLARIAGEFSHFAKMPGAAPSRFDLAELTHGLAQLHERNTEQVSISTELPHEPCYVMADRDNIQRVITNLLRNAIQAAASTEEATPQVKVSLVQQHNGSWQLKVEDNGPGVPAELYDKIFQPNFTTKSSGMGLGLAICRQIIEQAGGTIGFHSQPGQGSCFWFVLATS